MPFSMPECARCGKRLVRAPIREEWGGLVRAYCSLECLRRDLSVPVGLPLGRREVVDHGISRARETG